MQKTSRIVKGKKKNHRETDKQMTLAFMNDSDGSAEKNKEYYTGCHIKSRVFTIRIAR